jgi:hypothetical protein
LVKDEFVPFHRIFLLPNMFVQENKTHHTMQHGKLYKLQRTIVGRLGKKERIRLLPKKHLILTTSKIGHSEFRSFSKQKSATIK